LAPLPEMINQKLQEHDVVAVLGSPTFTLFTTADLFSVAARPLDESDLPRLPEGTTVLHVTDDPVAASWSMADSVFVCPPGPAVRGLVPLVRERPRVALVSTREKLPVPTASAPLTSAYLFHSLARELPPDAQVFEELPIGRADFHEQIPLGPDNGYFATTSGALGFPFSGAVGYALARPDVRTVVVVGEGSAQYSLHALWTAAQHRLPVTFVIPNNSGYLSLKYYLGGDSQKAWQSGWDLNGVDMAALARGFGCPSVRIDSADGLSEALAAALTADGPMLLDVVVEDPGLFRL
jgi:benzoylformate decarboxylase